MPLIPLSDADDSWATLKTNWRAECEQFDEDFDSYAQGTFTVLDALAAQAERNAGIYGLGDSPSIDAFCQANCTPLPGHPEPVLRVRLMTFAPRYDFGDVDIGGYAKLLMGLFFGIVELSEGPMAAEEIKFHLRSLADRQFFAALETPLARVRQFKRVEVKGMWLYVTKA